MISNQILQSTIDGLKAITKREITVMDVEGNVLATTDAANVGMHIASVPDLIHSKAESMLIQGYQYFNVIHRLLAPSSKYSYNMPGTGPDAEPAAVAQGFPLFFGHLGERFYFVKIV